MGFKEVLTKKYKWLFPSRQGELQYSFLQRLIFFSLSEVCGDRFKRIVLNRKQIQYLKFIQMENEAINLKGRAEHHLLFSLLQDTESDKTDDTCNDTIVLIGCYTYVIITECTLYITLQTDVDKICSGCL